MSTAPSSSPHLSFETGCSLHQAGRLAAEADRIYRAVLADDPSHGEELHLRGLARRLIGRAIALDPARPIFYVN